MFLVFSLVVASSDSAHEKNSQCERKIVGGALSHEFNHALWSPDQRCAGVGQWLGMK